MKGIKPKDFRIYYQRIIISRGLISQEANSHSRANPLLIKGFQTGEEEEGERRGRGGGSILTGCHIYKNDTLNPSKHQSEIRRKGTKKRL